MTLENGSLRILAVDDDPLSVQLIQQVLKRAGFDRIETSTRAKLALEALKNDPPPDLVLLDLNMPEMDGIEFIRHAAAAGFSGGVILVSGESQRVLDSAQSLVNGHGMRLLGQLNKPISHGALQTLLQQWQGTKSLPDESPRACVLDIEDLQRCIEQGCLRNHYQPKLAVNNGEIVGVEALVRLQHPALGLLSPGQFVAQAEQHGLIDLLTRKVLITAIAQARDWHAQDRRWHIAVNISMHNLADVGFADFAFSECAKAGVDPRFITLEVTESALMQDCRAPLDVLTRLRLKRFRLAIDDFGTGHSSLTQLRDIPFDELKIDRGFVHRAQTDSTRRAILFASRDLGARLGMQVVAEGVEDPADWQIIQEAGCDLAQGFLIARPMPAQSIDEWLAKRSTSDLH